jgi:hypothetical protein
VFPAQSPSGRQLHFGVAGSFWCRTAFRAQRLGHLLGAFQFQPVPLAIVDADGATGEALLAMN